MIKKTKTHEMAITDCMHQRSVCPSLERMLQTLCQALSQSKAMTADTFEVSGQSLLHGCARHCVARFDASHERIRIYCGVSGFDEQAQLERFARMILCENAYPIPASAVSPRPCAMGEARPRVKHQSPQPASKENPTLKP